jgi:hypothetical protein
MEVSDATDEQLWRVCRKLPSDFEPYGERKWGGKRHEKPDCSICRCFHPLLRPGQLDWGTCANPHSPRAGLLTFWEQGCEQFEPEKEAGTEETRRTARNTAAPLNFFPRVAFQPTEDDILRDIITASKGLR